MKIKGYKSCFFTKQHLVIFCLLALFHFIVLSSTLEAQENERPKVGLVLSGGGAKGLSHIGVLKKIEELGIPIDYIGGTSMGSIIGGLYAMGYSADSIERIVAASDWEAILNDKIPRKHLAFEEKERADKLFIPFPLQKGKLALPSGLIEGQNLSLLLSYYTWPVVHINNFNELPIPFLCVASDIEKGEAVVLNKGSLPEAIRASMAIPTIFTPVEIDGKVLVDGGIFNNFPVKEVKKMGADIIIGSNVGFVPYEKERLKSMIAILEQSLFIHVVETNRENQELCDILISPNVQDFNASGFKYSRRLIDEGMKAAGEQNDKLLALKDRIKTYDRSNHIYSPKSKKIRIDGMSISGLQNVPENYVFNRLKLNLPDNLDAKDIEEAIKRVYGTRLFDKVNYQIQTIDNENIIAFHVREKSEQQFSIGVHYDSDFKASLILNSSYTNFIIKGSKLFLNAELGENPRFEANYLFSSSWNSKTADLLKKDYKTDLGLHISYNNLEIYDYLRDERQASYDYTEVSANLYSQTILRNSFAIGLGFQNEYSRIKGEIAQNDIKINNYYLNPYSYLKFDTFNKTALPTKGTNMYAEIKYVSDWYSADTPPAWLFTLKMENAIPLGENVTFQPSIYAGTAIGDSIPAPYRYYMGGISENYIKGSFPFAGLKFLQKNNKNILIGSADLQINIHKNHYIILKSAIGKTAYEMNNIFIAEDIILGYGMTYSFESIIGPMEFTLMSSNSSDELLGFINIGYWF